MIESVAVLVPAVCAGLPPQNLAPGGYWPESCNSKTAFLGLCTGVCNTTDGYAGSPKVQCLNSGWSTTVVGACRKDVAGECSSKATSMATVWPCHPLA